MTVKRTITADKAGIIKHLEEARDTEKQAVAHERTKQDKMYRTGVAMGLDFAISVLKDWKE